MTNRKHLLMVGAATALWLCNGGVSTKQFNFIATAGAVVGAPVTPVSYAGVVRRSTVGVGAPGVGATPGVGVGAPGVGATPVPGVGTPANRGGPVNRVGVR